MQAAGKKTLPDEAPPIGKIHPFSKIAVTVEPLMRFGLMRFGFGFGFRISYIKVH